VLEFHFCLGKLPSMDNSEKAAIYGSCLFVKPSLLNYPSEFVVGVVGGLAGWFNILGNCSKPS